MAVLVGAQDVATSGSVTAAFPGSYTPTAGDFALVAFIGKATTNSVDNSPAGADAGGWTKRSGVFRSAGNGLQIATYYRVLAGGETAPSFTIPADWSGTSNGASATMMVVTGGVIDTTTPFDVADTSSDAAADPYTPPSITTVTNNALAVSVTITNDDNALALGTANGFTLLAGGASYDVVTGGDHSLGIAYKTQTPAGAVTMCTWDQTVNGIDGSLSLTFALKPAPSGITVTPGLGQLTLAGFAPTIGLPVTVVPGLGQLVFTGLAPTLSTGPAVRPGLGQLTLTGFAPTLGLPRTITPGLGQLTFTGFAPTIATNPITVTPGTGVLGFTGLRPVITVPLTVRPALGQLTFDGFAPTVFTTSTGVGWVEFDVIVDSFAGTTFNFRWAQLVSNALPLTVKSGSYFEYVKISS